MRSCQRPAGGHWRRMWTCRFLSSGERGLALKRVYSACQFDVKLCLQNLSFLSFEEWAGTIQNTWPSEGRLRQDSLVNIFSLLSKLFKNEINKHSFANYLLWSSGTRTLLSTTVLEEYIWEGQGIILCKYLMRLFIYPAKWPLQCDILYFQKINVVIFVWRTSVSAVSWMCCLGYHSPTKINLNQDWISNCWTITQTIEFQTVETCLLLSR